MFALELISYFTSKCRGFPKETEITSPEEVFELERFDCTYWLCCGPDMKENH